MEIKEPKDDILQKEQKKKASNLILSIRGKHSYEHPMMITRS